MTMPTGELLSDEERRVLVGEDAAKDTDITRDSLIERLQEQLRVALADFKCLYAGLTDDELAAVAAGSSTDRSLQGPAQHLLAFLYLCLQADGDDVEFRLVSAIKQAEATRGQQATVQLDVITEPFLPPKDRLQALKEDEFQRLSFEGFDQLFYDERVSPEELASVLSAFQTEDVAPETIRREREGLDQIERLPPAVVVGAEQSTIHEGDLDERDQEHPQIEGLTER
jgi:hypothetical protein